jgi:peptidoglycan/xylan/chitin deacetylase (PgdA/CDA1 family)
MKTILSTSLVLFLVLCGLASPREGIRDAEGNSQAKHVPILLYHRFGRVVADSMTVTTTHFSSQLQYFRDHDYTVIPLRQLVEHCLGKRVSIPSRSLVITVDDGHKSVFTEMFPLLKQHQIPATLFLYPSALANAPYAMTWDQLREMKRTGLFDFQSHTYWHPNFKKEKKRLKPAQYRSFVEMQLTKSKERLKKELEVKVDMLAWPFGIYDDELLNKAIEAGYVAGFGMERRDASISENIMALPRYLIVDKDWDPRRILGSRGEPQRWGDGGAE